MRITGHVAISVVIGGVLYSTNQSLAALASFLATSILIDIDHYIDYIREHGFSTDIKKIINAFYGFPLENFKKITLVFHSYELLAALCVSIYIFGLGITWKYAATGMMLHLFIDQMTNPVASLAYFTTYRAMNKFNSRKIFGQAKTLGIFPAGKRILERISANLAVRYSPHGSNREFFTTCTNISKDGMQLELLKKLAPGTVLDLEIVKSNSNIKAVCRGR